MLTTFLLYAAVGAVGGILAGLLGIGGGLVIVPMLVYCYGLQHIPHEVIMHLALGTSLASIIFTSISSFLAHHKRGAVDWGIVTKITPGILLGTFLGTFLAAWLSTQVLKVVFVCFLYYTASQLLLGKKPKPSRRMPGMLGLFGAGNVIGAFSSLVGIGGGTLSVPFMVWHNVNIRTAIGTASAIGLPIALSGACGYAINGWGHELLPEWSLGYVYLPALAGIVALSVLTAPLGARLAHSLPVDRLKKVFAVLLLVVATKMLIGLL